MIKTISMSKIILSRLNLPVTNNNSKDCNKVHHLLLGLEMTTSMLIMRLTFKSQFLLSTIQDSLPLKRMLAFQRSTRGQLRMLRWKIRAFKERLKILIRLSRFVSVLNGQLFGGRFSKVIWKKQISMKKKMKLVIEKNLKIKIMAVVIWVSGTDLRDLELID